MEFFLNWVAEHWLLAIVLALILTNGTAKALLALAYLIKRF
jgi:hypothetical protein